VTATGNTYRGAYKYLPAILGAPDGDPVIINQAYRYVNYLGEVVLGFIPSKGGYELVTRAGRYIKVTSSVAEDPTISASCNRTGTCWTPTTTESWLHHHPDRRAAGLLPKRPMTANLQADSSVWELAQNGLTWTFTCPGP